MHFEKVPLLTLMQRVVNRVKGKKRAGTFGVLSCTNISVLIILFIDGLLCSSIFIPLLLVCQNPSLHWPPPKSLFSECLYCFFFSFHLYDNCALFKHYRYCIIEMLLMHFIVINIPMFVSCLTVECNFAKCFEYISSSNNYSQMMDLLSLQ